MKTFTLFATTETPETRLGDLYPCGAFRWALEFSCWPTGCELAFSEQRRYRNDRTWLNSHTAAYSLTFDMKCWSFGFDHVYYDGPHCFLSLGPVHIQYNGIRWCDKCHNH